MFERLANSSRLLLEQELAPLQGDRFQPTGFADLGAAVYERADGRRMILVESAQSVANRLEATILKDGTGPDVTNELTGLPYVRVKLTGAVAGMTSSLVEAHRINSPFVIGKTGFEQEFLRESGYAKGKIIDWGKIAGAIFRYDPNSLLHGVFMANLEDGRVRTPRLLTGFVEAADIREAVSGGVKNNPLDPTGTIRAEGYDKDVYGNVPYSRTEYTAGSIKAYFNLDLATLRGYRLADAATRLLIGLALYKIARFLDGGLRLRTACDLRRAGALKTEPAIEIPEAATLLETVRGLIKECGAAKLFAEPAVTELVTKTVEKKKGGKEQAAEEGEEQ